MKIETSACIKKNFNFPNGSIVYIITAIYVVTLATFKLFWQLLTVTIYKLTTMKLKTYFTVVFLFTFVSAITQQTPSNEIIRKAQRSVCAIKIFQQSLSGGQNISLGCGVVIKTAVKNKNLYFIATANHVVSELFELNGAFATIDVFDENGKMYKADNITKKYVIWTDKELDAAIVVLPSALSPDEKLPDNYQSPGLSIVKLIGEPDWGQDIYLFGYRWMNENLFIDILKKGILSVATKELPGYEGRLVYLIDNMANKGMSGGLAFTSDGTGIGIISSYVYEVNDITPNSDDLSVCLPLTFFLSALGTEVISNADVILKLAGN